MTLKKSDLVGCCLQLDWLSTFFFLAHFIDSSEAFCSCYFFIARKYPKGVCNERWVEWRALKSQRKKLQFVALNEHDSGRLWRAENSSTAALLSDSIRTISMTDDESFCFLFLWDARRAFQFFPLKSIHFLDVVVESKRKYLESQRQWPEQLEMRNSDWCLNTFIFHSLKAYKMTESHDVAFVAFWAEQQWK